MKRPPIYGVLAEFADEHDLVHAARATRQAGYRRFDAYTPFPVEELSEAMELRDHRLALLVLIGGIVGALAGYGLQYWTSVIEYPINVGGRPAHSWPAFIVPTFETTILCAALAAVFGMLALNGLPMPYHPVFHIPRFALSSRDRFFLCIEAHDPIFDREATKRFLEGFSPRGLWEVPH